MRFGFSTLEDSMLEEEWVPPTEAEMKIINARRERQDKISKIMGQYLLQGYKMLATTCPKCSVSFHLCVLLTFVY